MCGWEGVGDVEMGLGMREVMDAWRGALCGPGWDIQHVRYMSI